MVLYCCETVPRTYVRRVSSIRISSKAIFHRGTADDPRVAPPVFADGGGAATQSVNADVPVRTDGRVNFKHAFSPNFPHRKSTKRTPYIGLWFAIEKRARRRRTAEYFVRTAAAPP